jgi:hypothetical protein
VDAEELVHHGKVGRLLAGFRGAAAADAAAVAELVLRISRLVEELPELAELDLNPLIVGADGCSVVDARLRIAKPIRATRAKTW